MNKSENLSHENKRIGWIDIAKGYGILFVILGHLNVGLLGKWIYTFHMPLFFFLSGYVFSIKCDFKLFVKKKIHSCIIPYFLLGIPMILFQFLIEYMNDNLTWCTIIMTFGRFFLQRRMWTLWYIACLFWLNIIFYSLVSYIKNTNYILAISLVMFMGGLLYYRLGGIPLPWNVDVCFTSILFFAVGYWFKNNYNKIVKNISEKLSVLLFIVMLMMNIIFGFLGINLSGGKGLEMFASSYGFPVLTIISAFCGVFCVVIFSHWFDVKLINYIGKNTLIYYGWHQTIMIPIVNKLMVLFMGYNENLPPPIMIIEKMISFIVIIAILTICNMVISKCKKWIIVI